MRTLVLAAVSLVCALNCAGQTNRWFYFSRNLQTDSDVDDFRKVAKTASAHGLNGVVLAGPFDGLDRQGEAVRRRLGEIKRIAAQSSIEIVPLFCSPGYAGGMLAHNRNLAEGLPVKDALFVVSKGEARLLPDPPVEMRGWRFTDNPGVVSFIDKQVSHSGSASLRMENFTANEHGHGRAMQEIAVKPNRCYRVTAWVKTESLQPASAFRIQVLAPDGRTLAPWDPRVASTGDWRKLAFGFNSMEYDKVRLYLGVWGGASGKFWLDDVQVEEVGLVNVLRRAGAPLRIEGEQSGTVYEEGVDFEPVADAQLNFRFDHDGPSIKLLPGSRIKDGERLRVSYYHAMSIANGQVTACMSEPELLEIVRANARLLHELLAPKKYLLSIDEIRAGGSDGSCKRRNMSMGQILGDFVTRAFWAIRENNPAAEVWAWADMLDPNHNAHARYFLVDGDFTGSWEHVPAELNIMCWYYAKRKESLAFFSSNGFRTMGGAYYDSDTLDNPKAWLEALKATPGAEGIMYTTWRNKYALLADFGDLVK